jgi:hypothetical protein
VPTTITVVLGLLLALVASGVGAEPVAVRFPEGAAHGFVVLRSERGEALAHGELVQAPRGEGMQSRLVFRFADGTLYDETVIFSQKQVFRLLSYRLIQKGPSFAEASEVSFDRGGHYRASIGNNEPVEGVLEVPDDVHNGMTGMLLRNLTAGASANGHIIAFTPKPRLLRSTMRPEGKDKYFAGTAARSATRYLVTMEVGGLTGVVASVLGKDPPDLRFWISSGPAPAFLRFEGAMFVKGPTWRIELSAPRWSPER